MSGWPGAAPALDRRRTLAAVAAYLRCPVCAGPVAPIGPWMVVVSARKPLLTVVGPV